MLPAHLKVKPSLIQGAGMGLFAAARIPANRRLGRYRGTYYARRAASDSVPDAHKPYLMDTIGGGVIDGYTLENHMRWANHARGDAVNAYAKLENDGVVFFVTLRAIEAGEEIYIDYGYDPSKPEVPRCPVCSSACVRASLVGVGGEQQRTCITCWIRAQY